MDSTLIIDPPVGPFSSTAAIQEWIDELSARITNASPGERDQLERARAKANEWLDWRHDRS